MRVCDLDSVVTQVCVQLGLAEGSPGILAACITTPQDMLPQLLCHSTAAAVVALSVGKLALSTVPQEQQPPLLLQDELLLLLPLFGNIGWVLLVP